MTTEKSAQMIADVRGYDKGNNKRPGNFMASLPFTREDDARYVLRLLIPVRFIRANPRLILQFNRHYRGPRLNAVPKILQANVFILGMLVVVVIRDRNCQRYRL